MKYYIAIVSGGFKTESILFEETGKVIAFEHGRGANAFDIGVSEATDRIRGTAENLRARLPEGGEISGVFGGISAASFYPEIEQRVAGIFKGAKVKMDSVVNCVMAADLGKDEDGVCLIAGTGSYCCVRRKGMHRHFIGSAGYIGGCADAQLVGVQVQHTLIFNTEGTGIGGADSEGNCIGICGNCDRCILIAFNTDAISGAGTGVGNIEGAAFEGQLAAGCVIDSPQAVAHGARGGEGAAQDGDSAPAIDTTRVRGAGFLGEGIATVFDGQLAGNTNHLIAPAGSTHHRHAALALGRAVSHGGVASGNIKAVKSVGVAMVGVAIKVDDDVLGQLHLTGGGNVAGQLDIAIICNSSRELFEGINFGPCEFFCKDLDGTHGQQSSYHHQGQNKAQQTFGNAVHSVSSLLAYAS